LRKGHRQILVPAGEVSQVGIALVARDAAAKLAIRKEADQLREDGPALVHEALLASPKGLGTLVGRSNRGKAKSLATHSPSFSC
jgi:hypothetical protein